jgi:hypothetical protein
MKVKTYLLTEVQEDINSFHKSRIKSTHYLLSLTCHWYTCEWHAHTDNILSIIIIRIIRRNIIELI